MRSFRKHCQRCKCMLQPYSKFTSSRYSVCVLWSVRATLKGMLFIIRAGCIAAGVSRGSVASVCLSVCSFACPRSKSETAWAINTKRGTRIVYSSRSACIDPEVKRSRSHGYENRYGRTVASDACCYGHVLLLSPWVCMSIRLPTFSSSSYGYHEIYCQFITAAEKLRGTRGPRFGSQHRGACVLRPATGRAENRCGRGSHPPAVGVRVSPPENV